MCVWCLVNIVYQIKATVRSEPAIAEMCAFFLLAFDTSLAGGTFIRIMLISSMKNQEKWLLLTDDDNHRSHDVH